MSRSRRSLSGDLRAFARTVRRWNRAKLEAEAIKRKLIKHEMDICYLSKRALVNMIINDEVIERKGG